jgi:hypothetical protein
MRIPPSTLEERLSSLGAFAAGMNRTEYDLLCLMILFHTHKITFKRPILPERPGVLTLFALTQRSAAAIAADAWLDRSDAERTNCAYWYHLFNVSGRYEVMEDVPPDLRDTVLALRARLLEHTDIASVEVED